MSYQLPRSLMGVEPDTLTALGLLTRGGAETK